MGPAKPGRQSQAVVEDDWKDAAYHCDPKRFYVKSSLLSHDW